MLEPAGAGAAAPAPAPAAASARTCPGGSTGPPPRPQRPRRPRRRAGGGGGGIVEVKVPDIGDYDAVPVIDIHVKVGDTINAEDALVTLESDKATMDVPSPQAGAVKEVKVKVGDNGGRRHADRGAGSRWRCRRCCSPAAAPAPAPAAAAAAPAPAPAAASAPAPAPATPAPAPAAQGVTGKAAHASPSVRKFARELGVDVSRVPGTGPKGRITQEDVQGFVKGVMSGSTAAPATAGRRRWLGRGPGPAAVAEGGLHALWRSREQAAFAHQEDLGRQPAPQLGHDPARHELRRSGHHRPRSFPRAAEQGKREVRRQGDHAGLHDQGHRGGAEEVPELQRLAGRRQPGAEEVLQHRLPRRTPPTAWSYRSSKTPTARACSRSARKWANSPSWRAKAS